MKTGSVTLMVLLLMCGAITLVLSAWHALYTIQQTAHAAWEIEREQRLVKSLLVYGITSVRILKEQFLNETMQSQYVIPIPDENYTGIITWNSLQNENVQVKALLHKNNRQIWQASAQVQVALADYSLSIQHWQVGHI